MRWSASVAIGAGPEYAIIDQNFRRHAPKPQESAFHPFEPVGLALPRRGPDVHPARIAKRPDKHMDTHPLAADPYPRVAEVDLHLMTRRRLEAHRRPLLRFQFAPPLSNPKFYRAQPDDDAMLARQLLANDVRVPVVAKETLPKPIVQTIKCCPTHGRAIRNNATFTKISANCVARASKLLRNSFRSPASFVKAYHGQNFFTRSHFLNPHRSRQRRVR
jgi:hypothetical protein